MRVHAHSEFQARSLVPAPPPRSLYISLGAARAPSGLLVVKMREMEAGTFVAAGKGIGAAFCL